ncbi:MAG: 50S ribosomal protein L25 [Bdellovibrionales bacterium]|nr:50S ribosomal protein L25 [Bdellovibrionales bacterium]
MGGNDKIELKAFSRTPGKGPARQLRMKGFIPAIVYGPKTEPVSFYIEQRDAVKYSSQKYENTIFSLSSDEKGLNGMQALKKTMDVHPVSRKPLHLEYYALDMTASVTVNVELNFVGKSQGEKDGGVFNAVRREIEIECLPTAIPEKFDVDISELNNGDALHVSDLKLGDVKIVTAPELTIATVSEVKEEVVDAEAAEAASQAALADPKAEEGEKKE